MSSLTTAAFLGFLFLNTAGLSVWTGSFWATLVGTWTSALLCRRLLLVFDQVYRVRGAPGEKDRRVHRAAAAELQLAAAPIPLAVSDHLPAVFRRRRLSHRRRRRCCVAQVFFFFRTARQPTPCGDRERAPRRFHPSGGERFRLGPGQEV